MYKHTVMVEHCKLHCGAPATKLPASVIHRRAASLFAGYLRGKRFSRFHRYHASSFRFLSWPDQRIGRQFDTMTSVRSKRAFSKSLTHKLDSCARCLKHARTNMTCCRTTSDICGNQINWKGHVLGICLRKKLKKLSDFVQRKCTLSSTTLTHQQTTQATAGYRYMCIALVRQAVSNHIALIKLDASCWLRDVMLRAISYIWSMLKPRPDMCWKNACFSTCTVMLFTPLSLNMEFTCKGKHLTVQTHAWLEQQPPWTIHCKARDEKLNVTFCLWAVF